MAVTVILDSNMLMAVRKLRLDVFSEIERLLQTQVRFATTSTVVEELTHLKRRAGDVGRDASLAVQRAERCVIIDAPITGARSVDDSIFEVARKERAIVATADAELRRKLRNAKIPVIYLRGKSRLIIEGLEAAYY